MQPNRTTGSPALPAQAPVKKPWTGGGFSKGPARDYESKEERTLKQKAINRQSARRDAIDYLTAQGKPYTLEQLFQTAELLFNWVNK